MSSHNSEESFFRQLKRLATNVDRGVSDLTRASSDRGQISYPQKTSSFSKFKTDVHDVKSRAQITLSDLQSEGHAFHEMLTSCQGAIGFLNERANTCENYLQKYGYQPKKVTDINPSEDKITAENKSVDKNDEVLEQRHVKSESNLQDVVLAKATGVPKLEDYKFSSSTLNLISQSVKKPQHAKYESNHVNSTPMYRSHSSSTCDDHPYTPTPFRNSGLIVTPSLVNGRHFPVDTPECVNHQWGCSKQQGKITRKFPQPHFEDALDSPNPRLPPTARFIPKQKVETSNGGIMNSALMMNGDVRHQFTDNECYDTAGVDNTQSVNDFSSDTNQLYSQEPEMPQLTVNLDKLLISMERSALSNTETIAIPDSVFKSRIVHDMHDQNLTNDSFVPQEPDFLTSNLDAYSSDLKEPDLLCTIMVEKSHTPDSPEKCHVPKITELPDTPKFLCKYNF